MLDLNVDMPNDLLEKYIVSNKEHTKAIDAYNDNFCRIKRFCKHFLKNPLSITDTAEKEYLNLIRKSDILEEISEKWYEIDNNYYRQMLDIFKKHVKKNKDLSRLSKTINHEEKKLSDLKNISGDLYRGLKDKGVSRQTFIDLHTAKVDIKRSKRKLQRLHKKRNTLCSGNYYMLFDNWLNERVASRGSVSQ